MLSSHLDMSSKEPLQYVNKYNTYAIIFGFILCKTYILGMSSSEPLQYAGKYNTYTIIFGCISCKIHIGVCPPGSLYTMQIHATHMLFIEAPLKIAPKCRFEHTLRGTSTIWW